MPRERLYRDPVHNIIILDLSSPEDRVLAQLIDSAEFQRLRRIKQLGMAHMAFQGAEHSRFTHCIGVMHLTRRLLERLRRDDYIDPRKALAVMCAALLHDVGHGPFSHVIEKFFTRHHEEWSRMIVEHPDSEVHRVLRGYDSDFPAEVLAVLRGEAQPLWLNSVISSQLDADRFDYLLRDSHMTGVRYGVFDLERLLLLLQVHSDRERVIVLEKGLLPVEKYLQSRYQMYRQVYFHKTVTAAESMLMAVLGRARDLAAEGRLAGVDPKAPLARVLRNDRELGVFDYLALDDSVLLGAINTWSRGDDAVLRDLSLRLLNRRLFKSLEISNPRTDDMLLPARIEHARELIARAGLDPRYYLLFGESADRPYRPYSPQSKKATIWIQSANNPNELVDVADASPTIRAFTESPYAIHRVFFPAIAGDTPMRDKMTEVLLK